LERIRAKREMTVKTEDPDDVSLEQNVDNRTSVDSGCSQTNVYNDLSQSDVKSLLAEFVLHLLFRLHRMHEMQPILTDVQGICLSVCLSCGSSRLHYKNGQTDQDAVLGEHSWGPMEHSVRRGS